MVDFVSLLINLKIMKSIFLSVTVLFLALVAPNMGRSQAAVKPSTRATIIIQTSAVCGMCKTTIESALEKKKGVRSSNLNVESKALTVVYNPAVVTPDAIRQAVSMAGYDADSVPADASAYEKLHACCKKGVVH